MKIEVAVSCAIALVALYLHNRPLFDEVLALVLAVTQLPRQNSEKWLWVAVDIIGNEL